MTSVRVCIRVVTLSNLNISQTSGPTAIKFYLKHYWDGEKADLGFGPCRIRTLELPSKKTESSKYIGLKINGEICIDPLKVVDKFNLFFSTIASSLHEKLPNSVKFGKSYVKNYYQTREVRKYFFASGLKRRSLNIFKKSVPTRSLDCMAFQPDL